MGNICINSNCFFAAYFSVVLVGLDAKDIKDEINLVDVFGFNMNIEIVVQLVVSDFGFILCYTFITVYVFASISTSSRVRRQQQQINFPA